MLSQAFCELVRIENVGGKPLRTAANLKIRVLGIGVKKHKPNAE